MTKARDNANNWAADITGVTAGTGITGGGTSGTVTVTADLSTSTASTSTTQAATPSAVKSAYDLADGAIAKSIVDAAGDLLYGTGSDAVTRLGIGTAGQVLKVNSGATAPEWGTITTDSTPTVFLLGGM